MPESKLFLIDAYALCYRSYFAIKDLSTSYGQSTNAVYGFVHTLKKILREHKPQYLAVCFDVGKRTLRQEKFAKYKIHRPTMPDNLISQIPLVKEVVCAFGLSIFELEGYEADDLIATIVRKVHKEDLKVIIVSGDKDMMQLADDKVYIFNTRKDVIWDVRAVQKQFGFNPHRMTDYIGLAGDKSDNIPGVDGIGAVTARNLINEFGSLENIFLNLDKVKSKSIHEKLEGQKEQALFSKELATLETELSIPFDLKKLKVQPPDSRQLFEIFKKLEFRKLAEEVSSILPQETALEIRTIETDQAFKELISSIGKKRRFAFLFDGKTEDQRLLPATMTVSLGGREVYRIREEKIKAFKELIEDKKILKISYNLKDQMKILWEKGMVIKDRIFDIQLAGYLLSPSLGDYSFENLAWENSKVSLSSHATAQEKINIIFDLATVMQRQLEEKALLKLFEEIEMPLVYVLSRMEQEGVCVDQKLLSQLSQDTQKKMQDMQSELFKLAGETFNLNSPKQLSHILFDKLKLPVIKKTKTGFSTDEGVLIKLSKQHPLPVLILEYRQMAKLKSTYFDVLPQLVSPQTGRIHARFNQTGTETGRLSSSNPNLQNIPIRTELGRQIRKAFVARDKEHILLSADYSQIELRVLAHLSRDKNLTEAFNKDEDIHNYTATLIFDVKEQDISSHMRDTAKRVNFGVIYGMSAFGLAKDLNISQPKAQEFIDKYFLRYPGVQKFIDKQIKEAEEKGFVLTILNRRRYLPEINSSNMAIKQFAQRQAVNTSVQGSAADLIKLAMINIQKELEERALLSKMIITVHDELVFDVPIHEKNVMVDLILRKMENSLSLSVPVKVSIKAGQNWLEMTRV